MGMEGLRQRSGMIQLGFIGITLIEPYKEYTVEWQEQEDQLGDRNNAG